MKILLFGFLLLSSQAFGIWGEPHGSGFGGLHFPRNDEEKEKRQEAIENAVRHNPAVTMVEAFIVENPMVHLDDLGHHQDYVKEARDMMQESREAQEDMIKVLNGNYQPRSMLDKDCDLFFERYVRNQNLAKQAEKGAAILYGAGSFGGPLLAFALGGYGAFHTSTRDQKSKNNLEKYMDCIARKKSEVDRLNEEYEEDMRRRAEDEEYRKRKEVEEIEIGS